MSSLSHKPHDRFSKSAFSERQVVREYLTQFLPPGLVQKMDIDTLEQQKDSYLDQQLREHFSDVVYTCAYGKSKVNLTFLLEHKSYVPPRPWLQLLRYLVNAYEAQVKAELSEKTELSKGKLTPVIPIVVYHGDDRWNIRPIAAYFAEVDEFVRPHIPEFAYLLTDLSQYPEKALMEMDGTWLKSAFLALKASRRENIFDLLEDIFAGLDHSAENERSATFIRWIVVYLFATATSKDNIMSAINNLSDTSKEKVMTIYDTIFYQGEMKGMEKGREEGREEGMEEGEVKGITKKNFLVFKNGLKLGLDLDLLLQLTGISMETALKWKAWLEIHPEAEFPPEIEE